MSNKIALVGNPNSGKTSLFNALTGKVERVGNWAGVTISKKSAKLKKKYSSGNVVEIIDLPGSYFMDAYTKEESVAIDFVKDEKMEAIINVIDATNLERGLYFTVELLKMGIPVIVAINKYDLARRKEITIDSAKLSELLNTPVYLIEASSRKGLKEMMEKVTSYVKGV